MDETVVGDVHQLPEIPDAPLALDDAVNELLGGQTGGLGLFLDLLAVLVGAGQIHHVIALQALVAGYGVAGDRAVGMPDMQFVGRVVDGGGDIEGRFSHDSLSCFIRCGSCICSRLRNSAFRREASRCCNPRRHCRRTGRSRRPHRWLLCGRRPAFRRRPYRTS